MKTAFALLSLLLSPLALASATNSATATQPQGANEPRALAEAAMKFVAREDMTGLFQYLATIMPLEKGELDEIRDNIVTQRKPVSEKLGGPLGFTLVSECRRSDSLVRVIYAEKRTKSLMRWVFIFYKPRDRWHLTNFYWDDNVPELFVTCT